MSEAKRTVAYFYASDIGNFYYGNGHQMKPFRIKMTHDMIVNYGLYSKLKVYRPHLATSIDMTEFHSPEYIRFLATINMDNMKERRRELKRFELGDDCPVFEGLYQFCQLSAGSSLAAARLLSKKGADICVNWSGGLHHAKKSEASGFCYVNDIVLAILELLKYYARVLYIDIDVHHGDGVEEAFYTTDRVMTLSFHKFGDFFPGSGDIRSIGVGTGKYHALNVPLRDGLDDTSLDTLFPTIVTRVIQSYRPSIVVMQCGADSLSGDSLGVFNLTIEGHGRCVELVRQFNLPLLMLGGGGYKVSNVVRCWTYETGLALGEKIADDLPFGDYHTYFGPDHKLHFAKAKMANKNTPAYLNRITATCLENLRNLPCAPSVQMFESPSTGSTTDSVDDELYETDLDEEELQERNDKRVVPDNEFYDSDQELPDKKRRVEHNSPEASQREETKPIETVFDWPIEDDDKDMLELPEKKRRLEDSSQEETKLEGTKSLETGSDGPIEDDDEDMLELLKVSGKLLDEIEEDHEEVTQFLMNDKTEEEFDRIKTEAETDYDRNPLLAFSEKLWDEIIHKFDRLQIEPKDDEEKKRSLPTPEQSVDQSDLLRWYVARNDCNTNKLLTTSEKLLDGTRHQLSRIETEPKTNEENTRSLLTPEQPDERKLGVCEIAIAADNMDEDKSLMTSEKLIEEARQQFGPIETEPTVNEENNLSLLIPEKSKDEMNVIVCDIATSADNYLDRNKSLMTSEKLIEEARQQFGPIETESKDNEENTRSLPTPEQPDECTSILGLCEIAVTAENYLDADKSLMTSEKLIEEDRQQFGPIETEPKANEENTRSLPTPEQTDECTSILGLCEIAVTAENYLDADKSLMTSEKLIEEDRQQFGPIETEPKANEENTRSLPTPEQTDECTSILGLCEIAVTAENYLDADKSLMTSKKLIEEARQQFGPIETEPTANEENDLSIQIPEKSKDEMNVIVCDIATSADNYLDRNKSVMTSEKLMDEDRQQFGPIETEPKANKENSRSLPTPEQPNECTSILGLCEIAVTAENYLDADKSLMTSEKLIEKARQQFGPIETEPKANEENTRSLPNPEQPDECTSILGLCEIAVTAENYLDADKSLMTSEKLIEEARQQFGPIETEPTSNEENDLSIQIPEKSKDEMNVIVCDIATSADNYLDRNKSVMTSEKLMNEDRQQFGPIEAEPKANEENTRSLPTPEQPDECTSILGLCEIAVNTENYLDADKFLMTSEKLIEEDRQQFGPIETEPTVNEEKSLSLLIPEKSKDEMNVIVCDIATSADNYLDRNKSVMTSEKLMDEGRQQFGSIEAEPKANEENTRSLPTPEQPDECTSIFGLCEIAITTDYYMDANKSQMTSEKLIEEARQQFGSIETEPTANEENNLSLLIPEKSKDEMNVFVCDIATSADNYLDRNKSVMTSEKLMDEDRQQFGPIEAEPNANEENTRSLPTPEQPDECTSILGLCEIAGTAENYLDADKSVMTSEKLIEEARQQFGPIETEPTVNEENNLSLLIPEKSKDEMNVIVCDIATSADNYLDRNKSVMTSEKLMDEDRQQFGPIEAEPKANEENTRSLPTPEQPDECTSILGLCEIAVTAENYLDADKSVMTSKKLIEEARQQFGSIETEPTANEENNLSIQIPEKSKDEMNVIVCDIATSADNYLDRNKSVMTSEKLMDEDRQQFGPIEAEPKANEENTRSLPTPEQTDECTSILGLCEIAVTAEKYLDADKSVMTSEKLIEEARQQFGPIETEPKANEENSRSLSSPEQPNECTSILGLCEIAVTAENYLDADKSVMTSEKLIEEARQQFGPIETEPTVNEENNLSLLIPEKSKDEMNVIVCDIATSADNDLETNQSLTTSEKLVHDAEQKLHRVEAEPVHDADTNSSMRTPEN